MERAVLIAAGADALGLRVVARSPDCIYPKDVPFHLN